MSDDVMPTLDDLTECWCGYKAPHARELMLHQLYCDPHNTAPKVIDDQRERIAELEAQLAAAQADIAKWKQLLADEMERNANNVANADYQIAELRAELTRLRSGGCARDQHTTQYCGEMQKLTAALAAAIDVIERYARLDAAPWGASLKEQNKHARGATEHFRAAISGEGE